MYAGKLKPAAARMAEVERAPRVVVVEGLIGAGKSTLLEGLARRYREDGWAVCCVPEPVGDWEASGVLEAFYRDPERYAFMFQTYVLLSHVRAIRAALASCPGAELVLLERSPASANVFWALQRRRVSELDRRIYAEWAGFWAPLVPVDLGGASVLYLRTGLEGCMARLAARGRRGEEGVTREYQAALFRAHEAFFFGGGEAEFPGLAAACPYRRILVAPPGVADGNFRDAGPERERILGEIQGLLALGPAPR